MSIAHQIVAYIFTLLASFRPAAFFKPKEILVLDFTKKKPARKEKPDVSQSFYFREIILDSLEHYFPHLRNMKRADHEAYALYSKLGATLLPDTALIDSREISPWFRQKLPTFGAIALAINSRAKEHDEKEQVFSPRFVCFTKFHKQHRPVNIQGSNVTGTLYRITLCWDDPSKKAHPWISEVGMLLCSDGNVVPLKYRSDKYQRIKHKRGSDRESHIHHAAWDWPPIWYESAKLQNQTIEQHLVRLFTLTANAFEAAQAGITMVSVKKDKLIAKFGLDPTRTAYFFKDRDVVISDNGKKKKIFHIVRTHLRQGKQVKSHFRGLRSFLWNGYQINITVPVREHFMLGEFDVDAHDMDAAEKENLQGLDSGQIANFLEKEIIKELAAKKITLH